MARESRFGPDAALAFSMTGLIFAVPAFLLPFVSAGKFGDERVSVLFTGVGALWDNGMHALSVLVFLCGALLPLALFGAVTVLHAPERFKCQPANVVLLIRTARFLDHWAFPEVQVLAVLVALMKLGSAVNVTIGPGFWCYCAMAAFMLLSQRSLDFESLALPPSVLGSVEAPSP